MEQSLLKNHQCKRKEFSLDAKSPPTLVEVTKSAYASIVEDLKRQVEIDAKLFPKRTYGRFVCVAAVLNNRTCSSVCWRANSRS